MYSNVGGKLKTVAIVMVCIGILSAIAGGIYLFRVNEFLGFVVILLGSLLSWVSSLVIYGIGHSIVLAEANNRLLEDTDSKSTSDPNANMPSSAPVTSQWRCAKCGTMNLTARIRCSNCGEFRK